MAQLNCVEPRIAPAKMHRFLYLAGSDLLVSLRPSWLSAAWPQNAHSAQRYAKKAGRWLEFPLKREV